MRITNPRFLCEFTAHFPFDLKIKNNNDSYYIVLLVYYNIPTTPRAVAVDTFSAKEHIGTLFVSSAENKIINVCIS